MEKLIKFVISEEEEEKKYPEEAKKNFRYERMKIFSEYAFGELKKKLENTEDKCDKESIKQLTINMISFIIKMIYFSEKIGKFEEAKEKAKEFGLTKEKILKFEKYLKSPKFNVLSNSKTNGRIIPYSVISRSHRGLSL